MEIIFKLSQIHSVAREFLGSLKQSKVVAFHGSMGAGKTTFIHALCTLLGVIENISSPTFSLIHEYSTADGMVIYHIDLYRLKNEQEAIHAGVEDCVYSGDLCFIEWPDKIPSLLPPGVLHVYLEIVGEDSRRLTYKVEMEKSF